MPSFCSLLEREHPDFEGFFESQFGGNIFTLQKLYICILFTGVSTSNSLKHNKTCPVLFIPFASPAFVKHAQLGV